LLQGGKRTERTVDGALRGSRLDQALLQAGGQRPPPSEPPKKRVAACRWSTWPTPLGSVGAAFGRLLLAFLVGPFALVGLLLAGIDRAAVFDLALLGGLPLLVDVLLFCGLPLFAGATLVLHTVLLFGAALLFAATLFVCTALVLDVTLFVCTALVLGVTLFVCMALVLGVTLFVCMALVLGVTLFVCMALISRSARVHLTLVESLCAAAAALDLPRAILAQLRRLLAKRDPAPLIAIVPAPVCVIGGLTVIRRARVGLDAIRRCIDIRYWLAINDTAVRVREAPGQ
jgi:hypothetical protein